MSLHRAPQKELRRRNKTTNRTNTNNSTYPDFTVEIVIPAWNEPDTVSNLIKHIIKETRRYKIPIKNVWLVTHDQQTGNAGISADTMGIVRHILVPQRKGGKNASLSTAIQKVSADYIIFIDGDITLKGESPLLDLIKTIHASSKPKQEMNTSADSNHEDHRASSSPLPARTTESASIKKSRVGAVAGRPAALDSPNTMMGFWAHTLTHAAHLLRLHSQANHKPINISGNLYIVRKDALPPKLPTSVIDDAFMSLWIQKQGYTILYQPKALAYQHYPKTYKDWITQKLRNIAGEKLTNSYFKKRFPDFTPRQMRAFTTEVRYFMFTLKKIKSPKQVFWLFLLYIARIHLWLIYAYKIYIKRESPKNIWQNWKRVG